MIESPVHGFAEALQCIGRRSEESRLHVKQAAPLHLATGCLLIMGTGCSLVVTGCPCWSHHLLGETALLPGEEVNLHLVCQFSEWKELWLIPKHLLSFPFSASSAMASVPQTAVEEQNCAMWVMQVFPFISILAFSTRSSLCYTPPSNEERYNKQRCKSTTSTKVVECCRLIFVS